MINNYDDINAKIDYLMDYYLDLQDYIERFSFPRIDYYYLIKNISKFYESLKEAKYYLEKKDNEKSLLLIPKKIEFKESIYQNTVNIKYALDEIEKHLKENKENQETNQDKFK